MYIFPPPWPTSVNNGSKIWFMLLTFAEGLLFSLSPFLLIINLERAANICRGLDSLKILSPTLSFFGIHNPAFVDGKNPDRIEPMTS